MTERPHCDCELWRSYDRITELAEAVVGAGSVKAL